MKEKKYIVCGVKFGSNEKLYSYLARSRKIAPGDYVVVPVGRDNVRTNAIVETVRICREDELPLPKKCLKRIIKKEDATLYLNTEYFLEGVSKKQARRNKKRVEASCAYEIPRSPYRYEDDPYAKANEGKDLKPYSDPDEDNYVCG